MGVRKNRPRLSDEKPQANGLGLFTVTSSAVVFHDRAGLRRRRARRLADHVKKFTARCAPRGKIHDINGMDNTTTPTAPELTDEECERLAEQWLDEQYANYVAEQDAADGTVLSVEFHDRAAAMDYVVEELGDWLE